MPRGADDVFSPETDPPVSDETSIAGLPVSGTLPAALSGRFLCIGPNPIAAPATPVDWANAEGMVHAVTLAAGGPASYRNRWIITDAAARKLGTEPVPGPRSTGSDVVARNVIAFGPEI